MGADNLGKIVLRIISGQIKVISRAHAVCEHKCARTLSELRGREQIIRKLDCLGAYADEENPGCASVYDEQIEQRAPCKDKEQSKEGNQKEIATRLNAKGEQIEKKNADNGIERHHLCEPIE